MKKVKEVLNNKRNWTSIVTILVAIFAVVVNFFFEQYSGKIISVLLAFIAVEFFILTIVIEDIFKKLNNKNENIIRREIDLIGFTNEIMKKAKHEVTIIGGSLGPVGASNVFINDISTKVKFRFLALNIDKPDLLASYNKLYERAGRASDLNHLKGFAKNKNIEIRTYERPVTMYYLGCDLNSPKGVIYAIHILSGGSLIDFPFIEINRPNAEWYGIYNKHIESLWNEGTVWKPEDN
jgi:hypothetical protein